ncbi:MAG: hypothetical protein K5672_04510 [Bacteroidaceae bacterium]|nr:hypothetical protein [Bacteroidaceae bacterium]
MKKSRFSMSFLALACSVLMGCNNDDGSIIAPQQPKANVVTLTTTVSIDGGAETRALTSSGVKTFAQGEKIAVVYENTNGETAVAVSEALPEGEYGKTASFTVTLTDPSPNGSVKYIYPAAMAKADGSINYEALDAQDGTLGTLASELDFAMYEGTLSANASLPASVVMTNRLTILAFTIKDETGANDLTATITGMTLSDGTNDYTVSRSAAEGPIYVAIRPVSGVNIEYTATSATNVYAKSVTGKTYAANNIYPLGLRMADRYPIAMTSAKSADIGHVITSDGFIYFNTTAAVADSKTPCAIIAYVGDDTAEKSPYNHGLAISLKDANKGWGAWWRHSNEATVQYKYDDIPSALKAKESGDSISNLQGRNDKDEFTAFYCALLNDTEEYDVPGPAAPANSSGWFLGSLFQWNQIVRGLTGKAADISGDCNDDYTVAMINPIIGAAGGVGFEQRKYWTCTEGKATYDAWSFDFYGGRATGQRKKDDWSIRSVFAF